MLNMNGYIAVTHDEARQLVSAVDNLATLAKQRGYSLSPGVRAIRNTLADILTGVDVSAPVAEDRSAVELAAQGTAWVTTTEAAHRLSITPNGVRDLCRRGRLYAVKLKSGYAVAADSIDDYLNERKDR